MLLILSFFLTCVRERCPSHSCRGGGAANYRVTMRRDAKFFLPESLRVASLIVHGRALEHVFGGAEMDI